MYRRGALAVSTNECNDLEVKHIEMGRWIWDVVNVKIIFLEERLDGVHLKRERSNRDRKWAGMESV